MSPFAPISVATRESSSSSSGNFVHRISGSIQVATRESSIGTVPVEQQQLVQVVSPVGSVPVEAVNPIVPVEAAIPIIVPVEAANSIRRRSSSARARESSAPASSPTLRCAKCLDRKCKQ